MPLDTTNNEKYKNQEDSESTTADTDRFFADASTGNMVVFHQDSVCEFYGKGMVVESKEEDGIILRDASGTRFRLTVNEDGKTILSKLDAVDLREKYRIRRMCMIVEHHCMICEKIVTGKCRDIHLGRMWGWVVCSNCIADGTAKSFILGYMTHHKVVPLLWMSKSQTYSQKVGGARPIKFFRHSRRNTPNPIYSGKLDWVDGTCAIAYDWSGKFYAVELSFQNDNNDDTGGSESASRLVALDNLFAHNPNLYTELTQCEDLLNEPDIQIGWSDLPCELRTELTELNESAKNADPCSFLI
ncbi:hypothetical protein YASMINEVIRUS_1431 [Yasminevirus sp. GU-2018]|uniref:Uncharacterized protein n=1 Tax=Yasminevirus sp. GU-2018 TaxID=2420051 RepID=A0A5K0U9Y4_9VIRU|nr:hypothetical protein YASMINEVIRUS_1431 [Yasminevirus sp. GU-2018]